MLVATRVPLQVGVVPWPGAPGTWTIVVKRSFELIERGAAPPAAETSSLGLDRTSADGRVLHPTDFAPSKQECDILVVGDQLLDPRGPVRLVAGELRKLAESAAPFGPRAGVGDSGDPMDPSLAGAWAAASFDPEAFQSAPRDQRIPRPRLPLDLVVDVVDQRFATRLEVAPPEAMFLDPTGWLPRVPIALRADTVTIDPLERRLSVVFRGLATAEGGAEPLLVLGESLRTSSTEEMLRWPRSEAIEPAVLRRLARMLASMGADSRATLLIDADALDRTHHLSPISPRSAASTLILGEEAVPRDGEGPGGSVLGGDDETVTLDGLDDHTMDEPDVAARLVLPFAAERERAGHDLFVEETADHAPPPAPVALPFARRARSEPPALVAHALSEPPPFIARPVSEPPPFVARAVSEPPPFMARAVSEPPPFMARAVSEPPPFVARPVSEPPPFVVPGADPSRRPRDTLVDPVDPLDGSVDDPMAQTMALAGATPAPAALPFFRLAPPVPAELPPEPPPPPEAPTRGRAVDLTFEQFSAIKADLWSNAENRRATLEKHGWTELSWRRAERRFVRALERAGKAPPKLVRQLRDEVEARRGTRSR